VDVIATDHAPHRSIDKDCTYDEAAFGITGLETALGSLMKLVDAGLLSINDVIARLTSDPCRIFGLRHGNLAVGQPADVVVFDPRATWVVRADRLFSKGKNTPLDGHELHGQIRLTMVDGRVVFESEPA
jgi:dihydroorotase